MSSGEVKLLAAHAFTLMVLRVKLDLTSYEDLPQALGLNSLEYQVAM